MDESFLTQPSVRLQEGRRFLRCKTLLIWRKSSMAWEIIANGYQWQRIKQVSALISQMPAQPAE